MNHIRAFQYISLFSLLMFSPSIVKAQSVVEFQPGGEIGKDANVNSHFHENNYENHRGLYSAGWTWSGNYGTVRSFIEFDLTEIPSGIEILEAKLSFYNDPGNNRFLTDGDHSNLTNSNASYLNLVTEPWDESTITWENQPDFDATTGIVIEESTSPTQDYIDLDVKDMVQYMVDNPALNHGFVLRLQNEERYTALVFGSSDNENPDIRPKLESNLPKKKFKYGRIYF